MSQDMLDTQHSWHCHEQRYIVSKLKTISGRDPLLTAMTKFAWGPLSWLTLFAILRDSPFRHVGQVIVCTAHLYGVALYYGTNWGDYRASGVSYSRPEVLYYWVYYVGLNAPWAVVPVGMFVDKSSIHSST